MWALTEWLALPKVGDIMNQTIRAFVLGALIFVSALIPPVILLMDTLGH